MSAVYDFTADRLDSGDFPPETVPVYMEWDLLSSRKTIAMVKVEMDINYMGNTFTVEETRMYEVKNVINPTPAVESNAIVLRSDNSWLMNVGLE